MIKLGKRNILATFGAITIIITKSVYQNSRGYFTLIEGRRCNLSVTNKVINGWHCEFSGVF